MPKAKPKEETPNKYGILHVDGSSNMVRSDTTLVLTSPKDVVVVYTIWIGFKTLKNEVEYGVFIIGIKIVKELGA